MTWNLFMERHDRWSGATLRSRIYALKDVGTNEEVIAMVLKMPEEKYKLQLIRKAIKLGNTLTDADVETLKGVLAASTFDELFVDPIDDEEDLDADLENEDDDDYDDIDYDSIPYKPLKPRVRIFTKRNRVMDALAILFKLPLPPEKKRLVCACRDDCSNCPRKKSGSLK